MPALPYPDAKRAARLVAEEYRTASLNQAYFGCLLSGVASRNRVLEILIAIGATGATGTGVASLTIWKEGWGVVAWGLISAVSILLATVKPFLNWPTLIEQYGKLYGEYAGQTASLRIMEEDFWRNDAITSEQMQAFDQIRQRNVELAKLDPPKPDKALIKRLQDEVNQQIPPTKLWSPPAPATP